MGEAGLSRANDCRRRRKLWTIPESWNHQLTVHETDVLRYWVYRLPETDVDLKVTVPTHDRLINAWCHVKQVGTLTAKYDDQFDWKRLDDLIEDACAEKWDAAVVQALEEVAAKTVQIEQEPVDEVNLHAVDAVMAGQDVTPSFDGWVVDPWGEAWNQYYTARLETVLTKQNINADTQVNAINIILDADVLPMSPSVRLQIADE